MSKRNSVGSSNTLFNYFTKTPPMNKKPKANEDAEKNTKVTPKLSKPVEKVEKKKRDRTPTPSPKKHSNSEDESPIAPKKRKRIRLNPIDSDDSDVENKDNITDTPQEKLCLEKKLQESFKYVMNSTLEATKPSKPLVNGSAPPKQPETTNSTATDELNWVHCKLEWLKPDKVRDVNKRRPDHPDYDATTLFVPPDFLKAQTPAHRQWWEMKSAHYDCVLFFKVGKFYELYHMDAAVGVNELGFSYMKKCKWLNQQGEFAHSGFPESAYGRMASTLVAKGYKVARVEQTETPEMMQERCKKLKLTSKYDKVVRREICQVAVRGAQVLGVQDAGPTHPEPSYMLAVAEEESNGISTYGVCFVDASIGVFHLGQFRDDKHSSRLLTMLAQNPPVLLVYDRKSTSPRTTKLLSIHCHSARRELLNMSPPEKILKLLAEKYYRTNAEGQWPEGIRQFLDPGDALGLTPAQNSHLAIKALGGTVTYLTNCLLDIQVLGMSQFTTYSPPDIQNRTLSQENKVKNKWKGGNNMVLDAVTLKNLRIVNDEGCLYDKVNFCSTAMGKRLLYQWVCSPSCNLAVIKERQEAIKCLYENQELCQEARNILTTLPDMERLLAKVHALGNLKRSQEHPDSRAILYEDKTYSKRSVVEFLSILNGLNAAMQLLELFDGTSSVLLRRIMQLQPEGQFPDYRDTLKFFREAFNQEEAQKEGKLLPAAGVDREYDATLNTIADIEKELKEYLVEQEKKFKCRLSYVGSDKKRYQLEVPEKYANKASSDYHMEGARKGFKRFSTDETKDFLARMIAAEDQKRNVLKDLNRRIFSKFSDNYDTWQCAVHCLTVLDVLLSFGEFARQMPRDICLPEVTYEDGNKPFISITSGSHPCLSLPDFIPNDTSIGGEHGPVIVLTGANMGGKSTLMRQTALITALAHVGSYVPAECCRLSLVDRIFTRLGASDDILSGQSTFLLEMNETAAILKHATEHSLLLIDELGRGTSTYDGSAIAMAVCAELSKLAARTMFSTHYHALVRHLAKCDNIVLGHMACMVETEETSDDEIPEETITFLYILSPGACPKSYGFNAARLAGVPRNITARAQEISRQLEKEASKIRAFREIMKRENGFRGVLKEICV